MTNASAAVETQDRVTVLVVNDRREILEALERFLNRFENVRVVGLAQGTEEAIDLAVLSRPPKPKELEKSLAHVKTAKPEEAFARHADLLWALLNSLEFRTNH